MRYLNYIITVVVVLGLSSCEYFKAPETTLNVQTGDVKEIKFPAISVNGSNPYTFVVGQGSYTEEGATATLGVDDISEDVVISGSVDPNTPGYYPITYTVSVVNGLGQESTSTTTRHVAVLLEDVSAVDLSGGYTSTSTSFGGASFGQTMTVTRVTDSYYSTTDIYAHPNADQPATFFFFFQNKGVLATVPVSQSIFGLYIEGDIDVVPGASMDFNLSLPQVAFTTTKPWVVQ